MGKDMQWKVQPRADESLLLQYPELPGAAIQLLANRGITDQEAVEQFLSPDYSRDQHDPYLFRDMQKAVERINLALTNKEKITIHGDYDADGVCGTAVLYKTLKALHADVDFYLPHRDTEGYGLNMNTVELLKKQGTQLLITVDCGISNKNEVQAAVDSGMEVIVTDHHSEPPELPSAALAVLNPKISGETYPFKYLAGVGVSFKLCQALIREHNLGEAFEKWLLDLVAISTVTDFVELIGENRVFLKYGLIVLQKNQRPGLKQLCAVMGVDATAASEETIGFKIGPHINAAGRVNHANQALDLMIEEDPIKAYDMAIELAQTNKQRQSQSNQMSKAAMTQAELQVGEQVIVVESHDWPVGLVGLVAGKVTSEHGRPSFVVTTMGDEIVGSGRSIEHFNLVDAMQSMDELFVKYGGHPMACGFTLKGPEELKEFTRRMRERASELLKGKDLRKVLKLEAEISLAQTDWKLVEVINQCAPYGQSNPRPVFASRGVTVEAVSAVGKTAAHLRMTVSSSGTKRQCIGFGHGKMLEELRVGSVIDIAYAVSINEWNGNREIQLELMDIEIPQQSV